MAGVPQLAVGQNDINNMSFDPEGQPVLVVSLDIADDQVQAIRAVSNPDKLSHLRHPSAEEPGT